MRLVDPVTQEVLSKAFKSICAEMGIATVRSANSSVIAVARDFSCALLDSDVELVAAENFDPSHLSAMALASEYALMDLGYEDLAEGDVILVNDPYRAGGHLADISLIRPVFVEGNLFAIAVNRAHHIDVGGMSVSGFPGSAESVFQEGLRIPPVKWFRAGAEQREVLDLISLNIRFPREQTGDFRAQLASALTAENRLLALCRKYDASTVWDAMQEAKNRSEVLIRHVIEEIPDGRYEFTDFVDDDGVSSGAYRVQVAVLVDGDEVLVDFTGSSPQAKGPINSSYATTLSSTFNGILQVAGSDIPFNHGCFRPVQLVAPRGTIVNPMAPAPVFGGVTEVAIRIIDCISGALSRAIPDRVAAGSYGTCQNFAGGGFDQVRDVEFGFYFFTEGGWGATAQRDGWNTTPNPASNFTDYPVEVIETELPLTCTEVSLYEDSGGPGEFRGGVGSIRGLRVESPELQVSALAERHKVSPFGLAGGHVGKPNALLVRRADSSTRLRFDEIEELMSPSKFSNIDLYEGDEFFLVNGGGGGFGPPSARDPVRVRDDVRAGLVSRIAARDIYRVALTGDDSDCEVNGAATDELRSEDPGSRREDVSALDSVLSALLTQTQDSPPRREVAVQIGRLSQLKESIDAQIDQSLCSSVCHKAADSKRCPYYNERALDYWDPEALRRWTSQECLYDPNRLPASDAPV
jgi:N-methylhydantoinase B/oxoprolinase/acetone carboxylase alpha subunit